MNSTEPTFCANIYKNEFIKSGIYKAKAMTFGDESSKKQAQLYLSQLEAIRDNDKVAKIYISEDLKFSKGNKRTIKHVQKIEFDDKKVLKGSLNDEKMSDRSMKIIDLLFLYLTPSHISRQIIDRVPLIDMSPNDIRVGLDKFC